MTLIDLGGPGCVRLNYISPEEGIAINVSYGDSLLHNETVKGPDPAPTCLSLFAKIAQMCARFSELLPTDDGLRGCLQLEPMILGEVQVELPIGCFRMGPNGMKVIESSNEVIKEQQPSEENEVTVTTAPLAAAAETAEKDTESDDEDDSKPETAGGYNTADIIAAVNESAEEGIALITNWLGFNVNKLNKSNGTEVVSDDAAAADDSSVSSTEITTKS